MNRRIPIIIVLLLALLASGYTRQLAARNRTAGHALSDTEVQSSSARLSGMKPFAIALLLGGLRGPLVMILWSSSESQKADKNLVDFDTKVEWIRLLQPEFDSVHIFQIWNKAYNISVQMASLSNKYLTIIDAIDYAKRVDAERPDDINIIYALGSVYGDKLGDAQEKVYYQRRVRTESKPHPAAQAIARAGEQSRITELPAVLDEQGRILPELTQPRRGIHLGDPKNPAEAYDGAELPFLQQFEPFPYGLDPHAFAYSYRKRAQLLQRWANERHAQLAPMVIDSRPSSDLRIWGDSEWDHARRLELTALGRPIPSERSDWEHASAEIPLNTSFNPAAMAQIKEAIYSYQFAQRIWKVADAEYITYMRRFQQNLGNDQSHRDEMWARSALLEGDAEFLLMLTDGQSNRAQHAKAARTAYDHAMTRFALIVLRYTVLADEAAANAGFPSGKPPQEVVADWYAHADEVASNEVLNATNGALGYMQKTQQVQLSDDTRDYLGFINRAGERVHLIPPQ